MSTARGKTEISPPLIIERKLWTRTGLGDKAFVKQPPQYRIQRACSRLQLITGAPADVFDDRVAVLISFRQRNEHLQSNWGKRPEIWFPLTFVGHSFSEPNNVNIERSVLVVCVSPRS